MPASLRVRSPGVLSTLQDLGRAHHQRIGVPMSGALDPVALHLANALAGNAQHMAVIEMCYGGLELEIQGDAVRVALAGGPCAASIRGRADRTLPPWSSCQLLSGEVLRLGAIQSASCAYLAVSGGLAVPPTLGSLSTYARAGLGGFQGRALKAGDELPLHGANTAASPDLMLPAPPDYGSGPVRVVLGPQDDHFEPAAIETLLNAEYTVSKDADRIGLRLDGPPLRHRQTYDIPSDGTVAGNIQVPGSGQPIILLPDRQTTGGYTKIATVITADLPRVGRLVPGAALRFSAVTPSQAVQIARDLQAHIALLVQRMVPAPAGAVLDLARLMDSNLISGVVDGRL
jgi:biotin-dependent carboxylase-like uncharacterized protein